MEETKNTAAIILDRRPYRESDSLVTVYTRRFGKQKLVARGTKKLHSKLAGHLEPLSIAEIMIVPGKNFDYIGAALGQSAYAGLRADLNKLYFAGQALSRFNRLVKENEPDERLFDLLQDWLAFLDDFGRPTGPGEASPQLSRENGELLWAFFMWKLLAELGYQPELYKCLVCRQPVKPGQNCFDLKNGGLVGEECLVEQKKRPDYQSDQLLTISDNCIKIIRFIFNHEINSAGQLKADKKSVKELSAFTTRFLEFNA